MFKNLQELTDYIVEVYGDDADYITIFTNPSYVSAFVGVSEDLRAVYDFDLMVEWLMKEDGCDESEAIDCIEHNAIRSLPYQENPPIILHRIEE